MMLLFYILILIFNVSSQQSIRPIIPLPLVQAFYNHTTSCPLQHNEIVFCNFHNSAETCICNYGSSSTVLHDQTWLCTIPKGEKMMGNYISKVIINRRKPFENDFTIQQKLLDVLEKYVGLPKENVIFLVQQCSPKNPNFLELYFGVKLFDGNPPKFYLFKDNYFKDFSAIGEQTILEIASIKVLKGSKFYENYPSVISQTLQPKSIDYEEFGFFIYLLIFAFGSFGIIAFCMARSLAKGYKANDKVGQNKDVEMINFVKPDTSVAAATDNNIATAV